MLESLGEGAMSGFSMFASNSDQMDLEAMLEQHGSMGLASSPAKALEDAPAAPVVAAAAVEPSGSGDPPLPGGRQKDVVAVRSNTMITLSRQLDKEAASLKECVEASCQLICQSDPEKDHECRPHMRSGDGDSIPRQR
eukprot:6938861-Alexandrium_andersonii.AAC.1